MHLGGTVITCGGYDGAHFFSSSINPPLSAAFEHTTSGILPRKIGSIQKSVGRINDPAHPILHGVEKFTFISKPNSTKQYCSTNGTILEWDYEQYDFFLLFYYYYYYFFQFKSRINDPTHPIMA